MSESTNLRTEEEIDGRIRPKLAAAPIGIEWGLLYAWEHRHCSNVVFCEQVREMARIIDRETRPASA